MATRSLNRVELIGNLTRDPELRYTSGGTAIATFSVATNRNYTNSSGENVETAEFTNVVAWAKLGEICSQLLKKGSKVYIQGRLQTSKWEDKETGKEMRKTEVVATDMILLSGGGNANTGSDSNNGAGNNSEYSDSGMGEDIDFSQFDEMDGSANKKEEPKNDDSESSNTPF